MPEHDFTEAPWRPWHMCLTGQAHARDLVGGQDATGVDEANRCRKHYRRAERWTEYVTCGRYVAAVVSDGVGSYWYSELGSRITVIAALAAIRDGMRVSDPPAKIAARIEREVPRRLAGLADLAGEHWEHCCYATLVVMVGTLDWFSIWSRGDGFYGVNADPAQETGSIHGGLPMDHRRGGSREAETGWLTQHVELAAHEVAGAWIATDGMRYLRPGKGQPVELPPVRQDMRTMDDWSRALRRERAADLLDDLGLAAFIPR